MIDVIEDANNQKNNMISIIVSYKELYDMNDVINFANKSLF